MSDVIGSAEFELRATRQQMKRDLQDAKRDLSGFVSDAERDVGASSGRMSGMIGKIGFAVTALTAVIGAGVAIVMKFGNASLAMAESIGESAKRIGIGTAALQEYQYVARKTGEDASAVAPALEAFANKLASAQAGLSKSDSDAFAALFGKGFDLRSFKSVQDALDATTDRIGELSNEADRAAIADKLGLGPLATALREGSDEVARLRDEAAALGFVMDDALIQKGMKAQGQIEDLSQVIGIQLAGAFIGLSDEVLAFVGHIAEAINGLNRFIGRYNDWKSRGDALYGAGYTDNLLFNDVSAAFQQEVRAHTSGRARRVTAALDNPQTDQDDPALLRQQMATDAYTAEQNRPRTRTSPSGRTGLTPVQPRGRTDNSEQRRREQEERRAERVEQQILRAKERLLGVADEEVLSAQQRYDLAQDRLIAERATRDAEIASKTERGEILEAERRQLVAAHASADAIEDRVLADRSFRDIQDEQVAAQQVLLEFAQERLGLEADGALTEKERRAVEREILRLRQIERRRALEQAMNDQTASPAERQAAADNLAQLPGMETRENRSFDQSSTGGRMALDAVDETRERAKWIEDAAEAYAEIDKLRQEDRISEAEAAQAKAQINADLYEKRLASTSEFFGNLATLANSSNHTLAAIGKAAGIAQATIDGVVAVQKAWASAPFPFNLPAVAATTVAVAANVATIAGVGFADGGYVSGPGSSRSDSIPARLSNGEFVINARAVAQHRSLLESINSGSLSGFADGGLVGAMSRISLPASMGTSQPSGRQLNFDLRGAVVTSDLLRQFEQIAANTGGAAVREARRMAPRDQARHDKFRLGRNAE